VAFSAAPVSAIFEPVAKGSPSVQPSKIRKEFPETWIWDAVDDMGLVTLIAISSVVGLS